MSKIVVVGGGPAGMMAAIRAGQLHQDVLLLEKNPVLGKKLLLSGKGRCNLTNTCDLDSFLKSFSKSGQFLRDAFKKLFNRDLMLFFQERGLALRVERQLRVFPETDSSGSVLGALKKELDKCGVKIIYKSVLKDIIVGDNKVKGLLLDGGKVIAASKVILASGGVSYGFTGSTGDGLTIARRLGHSITPLKPGLVPLEIRQHYPKLLEGLVLKNIRLIFSDGEKEIVSQIGELLFTAFGISGPLVLSLSGRISEWLSVNKHLSVTIDLKPALSKEQLDRRFQRELKAGSKVNIKNVLKSLLPKRMIEVFLDIAGIAADRKANQITQEERRKLVELFKGWRLNITKTRPIEEAMVTRGGVSLKEINPRTMESRLIKGLYFAGEIIDVDADTGGFNLQAAFSTGYLAGESASLTRDTLCANREGVPF
jgi:predicted Rossmann fold flavoprotein